MLVMMKFGYRFLLLLTWVKEDISQNLCISFSKKIKNISIDYYYHIRVYTIITLKYISILTIFSIFHCHASPTASNAR